MKLTSNRPFALQDLECLIPGSHTRGHQGPSFIFPTALHPPKVYLLTPVCFLNLVMFRRLTGLDGGRGPGLQGLLGLFGNVRVPGPEIKAAFIRKK